MIKALTRRCLGGADPTAPEVRQRCGTLAGGVGILLNTLLCLGKLGAGLLTGSIAVVADGLNNLSDAASSVITLIGFRLAGQAAEIALRGAVPLSKNEYKVQIARSLVKNSLLNAAAAR